MTATHGVANHRRTPPARATFGSSAKAETRRVRRLLSLTLAAAIAAFAASVPAMAASDVDPDWPCIQRLVPRISSAQVWAGPELDPQSWSDDSEVRRLAGEIAVRRMPVEEARERIVEFAEGLPETERNQRLTALFGRTLEIINRDRGSLISGIKRFSQNQRALAERIRSSQDAAQASASQLPSPQQRATDATQAQEALIWDRRVYAERQRSLTYLCEQPVLLDQRAFALGSAIAGQLVKD